MRLDMVAVVSPAVSPWCRSFSQTHPLAIQTASPYRSTLHAANPSAAFGIDCYCAPGTLRRGLGNVLRYGATKHMVQHNAFCGQPQWDRLPPADLTVCVLATEVIPDSARLSFYFTLTGPRCLAYKTKTLECLVPGSGSLMLLVARSTWTLHYHRSQSHGYMSSAAMLTGHPIWDMRAFCLQVIAFESS